MSCASGVSCAWTHRWCQHRMYKCVNKVACVLFNVWPVMGRWRRRWPVADQMLGRPPKRPIRDGAISASFVLHQKCANEAAASLWLRPHSGVLPHSQFDPWPLVSLMRKPSWILIATLIDHVHINHPTRPARCTCSGDALRARKIMIIRRKCPLCIDIHRGRLPTVAGWQNGKWMQAITYHSGSSTLNHIRIKKKRSDASIDNRARFHQHLSRNISSIFRFLICSRLSLR